MRRIDFSRVDAGAYPVVNAAEPAPGPGQVRVRAEAVGAGLGLVRMLRAGAAGDHGPGGEVVGRVTAVGPDVTDVTVGERVGGVVFSGAYAESVLALPAMLSPVPEDVGTDDALALVRGGLVALSVLRAGLAGADTDARGRSVLVTAAASGVGHLAVQLARALGAGRVVAVVGSAGKAAFVHDCGADEVVTYDAASWGDPVDVVLDGAGGDLVQRGVDALALYGRLVAYSAGGGSVDAGSLLAGHKTVTGFSMALPSREQPELMTRRREELWNLLSAGALHPATTPFPFTDAAKAVALIDSRRNHGRVLLHL